MESIKDIYDSDVWGFFLEDSPYSRQRLYAFKKATGVDYSTYKLEGDLVVLFAERTAEEINKL